MFFLKIIQKFFRGPRMNLTLMSFFVEPTSKDFINKHSHLRPSNFRPIRTQQPLCLRGCFFNTPPPPKKNLPSKKKLKQTQKIASLKLILPSGKEISSSNQGFLGFDLQAVMLLESRNLFVSIALPKTDPYPESGYQNDESMEIYQQN